MNRIAQLFDTKPRGILSVYFTAGYPQRDDTLPILRALQAKGIDMAEIGIPFSDPLADGPVIQASSAQALRNGMTLRLLFDQLRNVRNEVRMPLILMGYLNPIMQFGFDNFCQQCAETGIDGAIIPDLPLAEYLRNYQPIAHRHHLSIIMLITPQTPDARIRLIDQHTQGFIYMVSSAAVTGVQNTFSDDQLNYFRRLDAMQLKNPRLIGFGIGSPAAFNAAATYANGAIVGSRFIELLGSQPTPAQAVDALLKSLDLQAMRDEGQTGYI